MIDGREPVWLITQTQGNNAFSMTMAMVSLLQRRAVLLARDELDWNLATRR
jgi:hypothetical protein